MGENGSMAGRNLRMTVETRAGDEIAVPGAPHIPGLRFRRLRGKEDFGPMTEVFNAANEADRTDDTRTVEEMEKTYANLRNTDPDRDVVVVEVDGNVVGYKRTEWWVELDGTYVYAHFGFLAPEWRGKGIGSALFRHSEARIREIAATQPGDFKRVFETWVYDSQKNTIEIVEREGYKPVRYGFVMVRPNLDDIPDAPMPEGLEIRPVQPEHYRAIWEAEVEAFRDHWGMEETQEGDYERWLAQPPFQPELWKVGWDGDQVAGMVRNFVSTEFNARHSRKRAYTEYISVRRPWRRRGLARALIAESLRMQKAMGFEESALSVDAENPSGALQLYKSMGFEVVRRETTYRKDFTV
jgi:ribosomal protein S18 acetylase RimI-like enzyme